MLRHDVARGAVTFWFIWMIATPALVRAGETAEDRDSLVRDIVIQIKRSETEALSKPAVLRFGLFLETVTRRLTPDALGLQSENDCYAEQFHLLERVLSRRFDVSMFNPIGLVSNDLWVPSCYETRIALGYVVSSLGRLWSDRLAYGPLPIAHEVACALGALESCGFSDEDWRKLPCGRQIQDCMEDSEDRVGYLSMSGLEWLVIEVLPDEVLVDGKPLSGKAPTVDRGFLKRLSKRVEDVVSKNNEARPEDSRRKIVVGVKIHPEVGFEAALELMEQMSRLSVKSFALYWPWCPEDSDFRAFHTDYLHFGPMKAYAACWKQHKEGWGRWLDPAKEQQD